MSTDSGQGGALIDHARAGTPWTLEESTSQISELQDASLQDASFLTQTQLNAACGNAQTQLPGWGEELLRVAHCNPPPRATMDRMAKALARQAPEQVATIETTTFSDETISKS